MASKVLRRVGKCSASDTDAVAKVWHDTLSCSKDRKVGSKIGFELGMEKITNARNSLG